MPARFLVGILAVFALACLAVPAARAEPASALFAGFGATSKEPINVEAKTLEISEVGKERISVFSGGVVIRRGDSTLKASTVKLYEDIGAKPPADKPAAGKPPAGKPAGDTQKKNQFSRIEAAGKVSVSSGAQTVTGDNAVFNTAANTIVLAGNVVFQQGTNNIVGDRLTIDLTTGVARIEQKEGSGRIKGQFTPGSTPLLQAKPGG